MKKLFTLFLASLLLSSCGAGITPTNDISLRISGNLFKAETNAENLHSHVLIDDSSNEYFVVSPLLNLSENKYLSSKIELIGTYNKEKNLFTVNGVSFLEEYQKPVLEDVSLLDYKNEYLGFGFSYLSDSIIFEDDSSVKLILNETENEVSAFDEIIVEQFQFNYDQSVFDTKKFDTPLKNYLASFHPEISDFSLFFKYISKGKIESIRLENEYYGFEYYVYRNGLIYKIYYVPENPANVSLAKEKVFNDFLDSFYLIEGDLYDFADLSEVEENENSLFPSDFILNYSEPSELFSLLNSNSQNFSALYPQKWYFKGVSGILDGDNYSFVFNDQDDLENYKYFLSIRNSMPFSESELKQSIIDGRTVYYKEETDKITLIIKVANKYFLSQGEKRYTDFMVKTLISVEISS